MDRLQNIETFVRVAKTQNFAEAARQLRVAKSVVTTRIKQLEEYLGAPLFHRSTRVVRLSEVGQAFLHDCTDLVGRANDIVDQMRDVRGKPAGTLRVHALTGFVLGHFASLLRTFQTSYPDIRLDLIVSDAVVDPVSSGVDCALQIFPAGSTELISRPLFPVRRVFCATPQYLALHGAPVDPIHVLPTTLMGNGYACNFRFRYCRNVDIKECPFLHPVLNDSVRDTTGEGGGGREVVRSSIPGHRYCYCRSSEYCTLHGGGDGPTVGQVPSQVGPGVDA